MRVGSVPAARLHGNRRPPPLAALSLRPLAHATLICINNRRTCDPGRTVHTVQMADDDDLVEFGCEIVVHGQWQWIALTDASRLAPSKLKRCSECHGQVRVFRVIGDRMIVHFEHYEPNSGCSLGDCFDGVRRRHPKALE